MKIFILVFWVLLLLISKPILGQQSINPRASMKYKSAFREIEKGNYIMALSLLNEALEIQPYYFEASLAIAKTELARKKYNKSADLFSALDEKYNPTDKSFYYEYAIALSGDGQFTQALKKISTFLEIKNLHSDLLKTAEKLKANFSFAVNYQNQNKDALAKYNFVPTNVGEAINSRFSEYFPSLTFDGKKIIFTRRVNHQNEDFYESSIEDSSGWSTATPIKGYVNTPLNEGTQTVSLDEKWLAFTGCNFPDGLGSCDIYLSHKTNRTWSKPYNIGSKINSEFWESQPAFSPDKRYLYFAARLPEGYGGSDLYYSYLDDNGYWSYPKNLGPNINTPGDEISPFIHSDNETLYFTSNTWQGYGGMDIFMSRRNEKGQWQKPINLGYPINTIENESCLFINSEGKEAYYSSDRNDSKGGLDIYKFNLRDDIKPKETYWVKLRIKDRIKSKIIPASINILDMQYNAVTLAPLLLEDTTYLIPFVAGRNYFVSAQEKGFFYNYYIAFKKLNDTPLVNFKTITLDTFGINSHFVMKNIYFDVNEFTLKQNSLPELQMLLNFLKVNNDVKIRIEGHTDNTGEREKNMILSFQRAEAVVNFLKQRGLPLERLEFMGYGDTQPVATNNTEQGKRLNRRTEIKIIQ